MSSATVACTPAASSRAIIALGLVRLFTGYQRSRDACVDAVAGCNQRIRNRNPVRLFGVGRVDQYYDRVVVRRLGFGGMYEIRECAEAVVAGHVRARIAAQSRSQLFTRLRIKLIQGERRIGAERSAREQRRAGILTRPLIARRERAARSHVIRERRAVRRFGIAVPEPSNALGPFAGRPEHVSAFACMRLDVRDTIASSRRLPQYVQQHAVLPDVTDVAGVEAMAVVRCAVAVSGARARHGLHRTRRRLPGHGGRSSGHQIVPAMEIVVSSCPSAYPGAAAVA